MAEPEDEPPPVLLPCSVCSRTFKPESLQKHLKVCEKQASKKRKVFDSSKQRIQGTELAEFLPKILREKKTEKVVPKKPESSWKEKHLEFVAAIRAARGVEPTSTKNSSAVSKSSNEKCPHCDRNFGPKAFDRHIEWCKEQKARIPKSPASLIQAKERLEARTKYRAPPLAKSKRTLTREKYARASQYSSKESSPLGSRSALAFSKPQPQEVKMPETSSRIPGIRNKPKLSSSSPSCTLPSGNPQVKKREPSPSPSKRPFRSGSKTTRKGPVKPKNEETNSRASLFTSSCNITKIQPSEERHRAKEVKPNPVESRVIARKSLLGALKPPKRKCDLATNPKGVGAHLSKGDGKICGSPFHADGIKLQEKTVTSFDTRNSLLGENLQIKGTLTHSEEGEEDCVYSDNLKNTRTNGTKKLRIKLNDIDVNKENDGLFVSPCSIFQSSCNLVAWKDGLKTKQGLKGSGDSDLGNEICNSMCCTDDIQKEKLMRSLEEETVSEHCSEGRSLITDIHTEELTKFCVDSPRYGSGDSICQRDTKFPPKTLSHDFLPSSHEIKESFKCEDFSADLKKSFEEKTSFPCARGEQKKKNKKECTVISETFLPPIEGNGHVDIQQNIDSCHSDLLCVQEIQEINHRELHEMSERFEEQVMNEDSTAVICKEYCLKNNMDDTHSGKLSANEGRDHLASSQMIDFASGFDNSFCLKGMDVLENVNEKNSLPKEEKHYEHLRKLTYSFDLSKSTDSKTDINCKIGLTGNSASEAQSNPPLVSVCNKCSDETLINSNQISLETVDEMGDIQNSQVHYLKERLSQNLKAFDLMFSASEDESSDISIPKFNEKNTLPNNVGLACLTEQGMKISVMEVKELHPNTSNWQNHEWSDMLQDLVEESYLKSESKECSALPPNVPSDCDLYNFSNSQMSNNNQVSPANVKKVQETLKEEENVCIISECSEKLKHSFNCPKSLLPIALSDTTAVSFDVKGHLSLLTGGEARMNVSNTSVFNGVLGESNKTNFEDMIVMNNSSNKGNELNFSFATNETLNNLSTRNISYSQESFMPNVGPYLKDNNVKYCSMSEDYVRNDTVQQYLQRENSCNVEEDRSCVSLHDDISVKSDSQFSDGYESVLIKDSNYNDVNSLPFCKNLCLCGLEKDKIASKVCNAWSSCEEEETDLFYKLDFPENLINERGIDSPTDRIWELASQEFIKNVKKDSCSFNSSSNFPTEPYCSGENNIEENNEVIKQQKILCCSNYKRKNIQFKTSNEIGSFLFRGYCAFHQSKRRRKYLKKIQSSTVFQKKKKCRRKSRRNIEKIYNLEEPIVKGLFHQLSIYCKILSSIPSEEKKGIFRNTVNNFSFLNLSKNLESEQNSFNLFGKLSLSNSRVTDCVQNSESYCKNSIKSNESNDHTSKTEHSKNEKVSSWLDELQLYQNTIEEDETCTLKRTSDNTVVMEASNEEKNEGLGEALSVHLPFQRGYVIDLESVNLQRIIHQNEKIFRHPLFDIMKFHIMSELLCFNTLNSVNPMNIHCLSSSSCFGNQGLRLLMAQVNDKIQNNDQILKLGSPTHNVSRSVTIFYDVDESSLRENFVYHKVNDKYFSSESESTSFTENQFLEFGYFPMHIFKGKNKLSSCIEEEEYRDIMRNSSLNKSLEKASKEEEMNAELDDDLKSHIADWQATDKDYEFHYEILKQGLNQTFENRLQYFCEHSNTDSCNSQHSEAYELPMEALQTQKCSYERDEDMIRYDLLPEILGNFEMPHLRNCPCRNVCCECSQEFFNDFGFDSYHGSHDLSHFAFKCVDNNSQLGFLSLYPECLNVRTSGVLIKELPEECEEQLSDIDIHQDNDNCNMFNVCISALDKTSCTAPLNDPCLEEKNCSYNLDDLNESMKDFIEPNQPKCIEEKYFVQTDEILDTLNVGLHSTYVPLSSGTSSCTSDHSVANVCYHPCKLDRLVPLHDRKFFCFNFPSFLFNEDDDFDVKIWTSSIKIPLKNVALLTHSFQSSPMESYETEDEEALKKFDFHERVAQNMMVMQQNNDCLFEGTGKSMKKCNIHVPKRKTSASIFKETISQTTEKEFKRPSTSGTNFPSNQTLRSNTSLFDLAMSVKGVIQSERSKMSEVQTCKTQKLKGAKECDMSLLKLVEKWSTKDKMLKRPKTYDVKSKKTSVEFMQGKQQPPKIHRLPPLPSPPKCCLQNSSSEEVYDPYISAERQMMELLSQGDFTQLSPRQNKSISSSQAESTVFPSFESSHRSAFVSPEPPRVFSSSKSHLEKGDADKGISEDTFMLKSESSINNELFTQLKSHSAGGKFSADSAYGSLNRRSPSHSTGKQMPGKHEEIEGDRLCFMSSSSSESSLPPLCAVQVVKREASNPSLSPSPSHAVDASPILQSVPRMSKFCHECGSKYPVSLAKFCCECGVRRLAM